MIIYSNNSASTLILYNKGYLLLSLIVSHIQHIVLVANPKKLLYTVAIPARGLLNREENKNKKSGNAISPPAHTHTPCSFGENKNKYHATHLSA